jgi:hypothetical protein
MMLSSRARAQQRPGRDERLDALHRYHEKDQQRPA